MKKYTEEEIRRIKELKKETYILVRIAAFITSIVILVLFIGGVTGKVSFWTEPAPFGTRDVFMLILLFSAAIVFLYVAFGKNPFADNQVEKKPSAYPNKDCMPKEVACSAAGNTVLSGEEDIKKLHALKEEIADSEIKDRLDFICDFAEEIFTAEDSYLGKDTVTRKFASYYIPTVISLVETYIRVKKSSISLDGSHDLLRSIKIAIENIYKGFVKHKNDIFELTEIEVSAEIDALNAILSHDGLLVDQNIVISSDENDK